MPRIAVILNNSAECELDRQTVEVADVEEIDGPVGEVIEGWTLSVGDTIRIVEA